MELRHLRYLVAVARELNFTKASQAVHTAQPSISQQIKQLEADVGVTLFYRNKHEVRLTNAGAVLYQRAQDILRQIDEAAILARKAAEAEDKQVTIGLNPAAEIKVLPQILAAIGRTRSVSLVIESHSTDEQIPLLRSGRLDAAFLRASNPLPSDIVFETVLSENIVAVLPANHPLARQKAIRAEELGDIPYVVATGAAIRKVVEEFLARSGVRLSPVQSAENILAALNLVGAGLGFTLVPDYAEAILPKNTVIRPLHAKTPPVLFLMVAYRKDNQLPALQTFRSILRDCFPTGRS
jgi:LysR family transcriptional regulator, hca operon transcriptional activator